MTLELPYYFAIEQAATVPAGAYYGFGRVTRSVPIHPVVLPDILHCAGLGMPELTNVRIPLGLAGGSTYQRTVYNERIFYLTFYVAGDDYAGLKALRKELIELFKPYRGLITIRALGGTKIFEIRALYDGGLEGGGDKAFYEAIPIRFLAPDPRFVDSSTPHSAGPTLFSPSTLTLTSYVLHYKDGQITQLADIPGKTITKLFATTTGKLYAFGTGFIAYWDPVGEAWTVREVFTGGTQTIYAVAQMVGSDTLLIGGNFTTVNGTTCNGICKYSGGAAGTFTVLAGGLPDAGSAFYAICYDPGRDYYVIGGAYNTVNSLSGFSNIGVWNGLNWYKFGDQINTHSYGVYGAVWAIAVDVVNDTIYIGGEFTKAYNYLNGETTLSRIAFWPSSNPLSDIHSSWTSAGSFNNTVKKLVWSGGKLYASGTFTNTTSVAVMSSIGYWKSSLLCDLSPVPADWQITDAGVIWASGAFTQAGNVALPGNGGFAFWNGLWNAPSVALPGTPTISLLAVSPADGSIYMLSNTIGDALMVSASAAAGTGTSDEGNYPIIHLTGPGKVYEIANVTTGERIQFSGLELAGGEEAVLDLSRLLHLDADGNETTAITFISSVNGDVSSKIVAGSDTGTFHLQEGANSFTVFADDDITLVMEWRDWYWSIDEIV